MLKEELGSMVDKEMIATSTAIEEAVLRMDVRTHTHTHKHTHTLTGTPVASHLHLVTLNFSV